MSFERTFNPSITQYVAVAKIIIIIIITINVVVVELSLPLPLLLLLPIRATNTCYQYMLPCCFRRNDVDFKLSVI